MKPKITLLLLTFFMFVSNTYSQELNLYSGGACIDPTSNCVASSAKITGAFIGLYNGNPITDANVGRIPNDTSVYLFLQVNKTGSKYDLYVEFNVVNLSVGTAKTFVQAFRPGAIVDGNYRVNYPITGYITNGEVNSVYGLYDIITSWDNTDDGNLTCGVINSSCNGDIHDFIAVGPFKAFALQTPILCKGGTSVVTIGASGGTLPYTGTGTFNRVAGTHTFIVSDNAGHTENLSVTIAEPTTLIASSSALPISCNGGTTTLTVSASGGTAPYTGTGSFTLSAGSYSYTVTDANGCKSTTTCTIVQPNPVSVTANQTNVLCNGLSTGAINITAAGGVAPYTYAWTGAGVIATAEDQTGLAAGTYKVIVKDANNCVSAELSVTITQPEAAITLTATPSQIVCFGGTGSVVLSS
ncbi:MAG TPA: SprB repeat-containing protein, partial [Flavobacterium sp.]|nr:SprB repeat-containing protein [Flavobacterium sp.]